MTYNKRKERIEEIFNNFQSLRRALFLKKKFRPNMLEITPSQWAVLGLVGNLKETTVKDVAHILRMSSPAVSQLVEALVKNNYVSKKVNLKDRRESTLVLSLKSRKHMEMMKKKAFQDMTHILKVLNNQEFEQFYKLNKKITANIK